MTEWSRVRLAVFAVCAVALVAASPWWSPLWLAALKAAVLPLSAGASVVGPNRASVLMPVVALFLTLVPAAPRRWGWAAGLVAGTFIAEVLVLAVGARLMVEATTLQAVDVYLIQNAVPLAVLGLAVAHRSVGE